MEKKRKKRRTKNEGQCKVEDRRRGRKGREGCREKGLREKSFMPPNFSNVYKQLRQAVSIFSL